MEKQYWKFEKRNWKFEKKTRNLEKFVNWEKIRTLENNFEIWKKYEEFWNLKKRINKNLKLWGKNKENLMLEKFGNDLKFEKYFTSWDIGSLKFR